MSWSVGFAVFRREWREHWPLVAATPLLGLVPLVAPRLGGVARMFDAHGVAEARQAVAGVLVAVVGLALSATLAAGLLARDLAERRAGFYFSRPIPVTTLWLAKLAAATSLVLAALAGLVAPTWIVDPLPLGDLDRLPEHARALSALHDAYIVWDLDHHPRRLPLAVALLGAVAALALALGVGHGIATALRSRDPWTLVDLLGLGVVAGLLALARDTYLATQAQGPMVLAERVLFVLALGAVVGAGIAQLAIGRVDLRRGHAAFSITLWTSLTLVAAGLWGHAAWSASPTFDDLVTLDASAVDPTGRWWLATGALDGRPGQIGSFLVDLEADDPASTAERIGGPLSTRTWAISADGSRIAWLRCRRVAVTRCTVWTRDLRAGTPARPTPVEITSLEAWLLLSPDGTFLAALSHSEAVVHRMPTGELVGAARGSWVEPLAFVDRDTLRFLRGDEARTRIVELGPDPSDPGRPWITRETGTLPGPPDGLFQVHAASGRMLLGRVLPVHHSLRDARTGEVELDLATVVPADRRVVTATFLDDGRVLVALTDSAATWEILVVDPESSEPPARLALPPATGLRLGAEIEPGHLLVGLDGPSPSTVVVDADRGAVESLADDLLPLRVPRWPGRAVPPPGSDAARLFVDDATHLVRLDRVGGRSVLIGPLRTRD